MTKKQKQNKIIDDIINTMYSNVDKRVLLTEKYKGELNDLDNIISSNKEFFYYFKDKYGHINIIYLSDVNSFFKQVKIEKYNKAIKYWDNNIKNNINNNIDHIKHVFKIRFNFSFYEIYNLVSLLIKRQIKDETRQIEDKTINLKQSINLKQC